MNVIHPSITEDEYTTACERRESLGVQALSLRERSVIEVFGVYRDEPDHVVCYVEGDKLTNWSGISLGKVTRRYRPTIGKSRRRAAYEMIYGVFPWSKDTYVGRCGDSGTIATMKRTKGS